MNDFVTVGELAEMTGLERSNLVLWARSQGFQFQRTITPTSRGRKILSISKENAAGLIALRKTKFPNSLRYDYPRDVGAFYAMQLVPDLKPERISFGIASNVDAKLESDILAAPTCAILAQWPARSSWRDAAIDYITAADCTKLSEYIFDFESVDDVQRRGDAFFAFMPKL